MKKGHWQEDYNASELLNGKSISIPEVKTIYQSLLSEYKLNAQEIVDSVELNDYVRLTHLLTQRNQIISAIEAIELVSEKDITIKASVSDRVANVLSNSAKITDDKGEEVLLKVTNGIENLNLLALSLITSTIGFTFKTISKGNQLNYEASRYLLNKTSNGLSKLANKIRDKF